jgi:YVTN family beta-propeller protein
MAALLIVGAALFQITAARGQDAYVPNQGSDDITIFDTLNRTDLVTRSGGDSPHEGVATLDARYVFFSNLSENTLSVFNAPSRDEIDLDGDELNGITRLDVGSRPHGLAVTLNNRYVLVTHDGSNDVYVVAIATLEVVATVDDVGLSPHMIAISPDGREAWIGNGVGGDVSILDVSNAINDPANAVICVTPGGTGPECRIPTGIVTEGVAFTRDGKTAYAASGGSFSVSVIDVASRTVVGTLPVAGGPRRVVVSPDGRRAYVTELNGFDILVIDTATHQLIPAETITNVPNGLGMGFSADGSHLYVANIDWSTVTMVNLQHTSVRETVNTGAYPNSVVVLPDEVITVRYRADLVRLTWKRNYIADGYHIYRGVVSQLPDYGACADSADPNQSDYRFDDPELPPFGDAFFYLFTTEHDGTEGILGRATDGTLRQPEVACPSL